MRKKLSNSPRVFDAEISTQKETCGNPFVLSCGSQDIQLYILVKGIVYPICEACWNHISRSNRQWHVDKGVN